MSSPTSLITAINIDCSSKAFDASLYTIIINSRKFSQIILEGYYDYVVLNKFFALDKKIVCLISNGRGNVTKIMKRLSNNSISNVVGIADRDYDLNPFANGKIFYYDNNNFEMMIVKNDEVFNHNFFVDGSYSNDKKDSILRSRDSVFEKLRPISIARLINARYCSSNKFSLDRVIPEETLYKVQTVELNSECIKRNIRRELSGLESNVLEDIIHNYEIEFEKTQNCFDITQGHDFVRWFIGGPFLNFSEKDLYDRFSISFTEDIFKNTNLYKSLKRYETTETTRIINI